MNKYIMVLVISLALSISLFGYGATKGTGAEPETGRKTYTTQEYVNAGVRLIMVGKYDDALILMNRAVENDPKSEYALSWRGDLYTILKRYDEAIKDFSKVIENNPRNEEAFKKRGTALYLTKRYDDALQDLSKAILINNNNASTYQLRAEIYSEKGDTEKAFSDVNKAITLDPKLYPAYATKARICDGAGLVAEAIESYRKFLEYVPDDIPHREEREYARKRINLLQSKINAAFASSGDKPEVFHAKLLNNKPVGDLVLGLTTVDVAKRLFEEAGAQFGSERKNSISFVIEDVSLKPKSLYNPSPTMYQLYFDEKNVLVLVVDGQPEGIPKTGTEFHNKYKASKETQRYPAWYEMQTRLSDCVVLIAIYRTDDSLDSIGYAYSCATK